MELKPCPFCGGEAIDCEIETGNWRIGCNNARCRGDWFASKFYPTKSAAIEAWNTRAERTCRIKEDDDTGCFLTCSECGAIQPEEWTVYYCWCCGARVVEEVDADGQG